ncbi:MAG TPA: hypothetical protein VEV42_17355 [Pyrinomonadaceae bacterium]|nr:hypothetical protein [Pyrinomonadaceae bacterium]
MKLLLLFIPILIFTGCTRPVDHPISENCLWTEQDARPFDLNNASDRRHLRDDAVTAEDMAIRWADRHWGLRPEYEPERNKCMNSLFSGVATQHGVDVAVVRQYSRKRDVVMDAAVILGFGAVYGVVAYIFAGRIRQGFTPDEPGFWILTITLALGISLVGVLAGGLWSIVVEELRMGSGHLSYRMNRIPFRQHWVVVFVCCIGVFTVAALIRSRVPVRIKAKPSLQIT